ncbi:biopolymer transporter ExbD [Rhodobacteraceae bacterium]|nr:biopolymer transporter ExbD [Paracoccaceae bacterium]
MQFDTPPKRTSNASLLPMINVVFLLLIFFLISAKLAPPEPFPTEPPKSVAEAEADGEFTVHLGAQGQLGFRADVVEPDGDTAALIEALQSARTEFCASADCGATAPKLMLRADQHVPAQRLAALLPKLGQAGFARVELVTGAGGGV